jgi:hypothetical protein
MLQDAEGGLGVSVAEPAENNHFSSSNGKPEAERFKAYIDIGTPNNRGSPLILAKSLTIFWGGLIKNVKTSANLFQTI